MVDRQTILKDLQSLLPHLETDLRERITEVESLDARLRADYTAAKEAARTAQSYEQWREEAITQAAVAWILGCVFVRFLEDNQLIAPPCLAGPGERLKLARDHHTVYFQKHPSETDREYLFDVFRSVATLPAARELFDERHNPLWSLPLSGDGARRLLEFWQQIDPKEGTLLRDFTDPTGNTRFLGDLYQDLSEAARKKYALLQTPEFVEEFILHRTLTPAIEQFGYREARLIDPTCGSGHFLLGAFSQLFSVHQKHEPAVNLRELAQRALDGVYGVDLNPFATAIARFRLLLAALKASAISRLVDAPKFRINVATGDSLLHGKRFLRGEAMDPKKDQLPFEGAHRDLAHVYRTEDADALARILGQQYHAVVGNPPYITVKDAALTALYRSNFGACHRQYSLSVPFMQRFFDLALAGRDGEPAGFVGQITANSFMKREFGSKLIEKYIPNWDLTHVIDTSGAYIPGHGTPTVILFGRNRRPVGNAVRAVMGIRGEPTTPEDPSRGLVWAAIAAQVDHPDSTSDWVSASNTARESFHKHPWSIGGGGAAALKETLDDNATSHLLDHIQDIGRTTHTGEDDAFYLSPAVSRSRRLSDFCVPLVVGEDVRDYTIAEGTLVTILPYDRRTAEPVPLTTHAERHFWPLRTTLRWRRDFGQTPAERGLRWFDHSMFFRERFRTPFSISFAFVATHNHFVLDRGGKVFKQTAPVIKLKDGATEDDHLSLLGLLNSSTACFWMKQTFFDRGGGGIGGGIASEAWEKFYEHDGTKVQEFPLPQTRSLRHMRTLASLAAKLQALSPSSIVRRSETALASCLAQGREATAQLVAEMISVQEELDWESYRIYGLLSESPAVAAQAPAVQLGERAFEIHLARRVGAGEVATMWFERHGSTPVTELPTHWPDDYQQLVRQRIETILTNPSIRLIEQPEYKRRWNLESWEVQQERALRAWLLDRLESSAYWGELALATCARLADRAQADERFMSVGEIFRGRADFDVGALVAELVASEAVPFLPVLRYKGPGLRKRELWEQTWALQRREDAGVKVDEIAVPPKYASADFLNGTLWRLRGKLDVPKERFISYPGCERDADPSLVVGWAGWDHLQQAQALAGYYVDMKDKEGWGAERLTPLLAGLLELLPWLEQWHNDADATVGMSMAEYFRRFVDEETRSLELTPANVRSWTPLHRVSSGTRKSSR
jgi:hypothetical protein